MKLNDQKLEVIVRFFSEEDGGRSNGNPACLADRRYRPHFVVKGGTSEEGIGVIFENGPDQATPGKEWAATVTILFAPHELLPVHAQFKIQEGSKIVGEGHVTKWLS